MYLYLNGKIVHDSLHDVSTYTIKNVEKYGSGGNTIKNTDKFATIYAKNFDEDDNVLYWEYQTKHIDIILENAHIKYYPTFFVVYRNPINDMCPCIFYDLRNELFNVLQDDGEDYDDIEYNDMSDEEKESQDRNIEEYNMSYLIYKSIVKYCKDLNYKYFVITETGLNTLDFLEYINEYVN